MHGWRKTPSFEARVDAHGLHTAMLYRRHILSAALAALAAPDAWAERPPQRFRGKLVVPAEDLAWLELEDGAKMPLSGDEQTNKVLKDRRLNGWDFEVYGNRQQDGSFVILPIHQAALFTYRDGKQLRLTYYCDVCAIRTYSPGICACCRDETRLDPVDPKTITRSVNGPTL